MSEESLEVHAFAGAGLLHRSSSCCFFRSCFFGLLLRCLHHLQLSQQPFPTSLLWEVHKTLVSEFLIKGHDLPHAPLANPSPIQLGPSNFFAHPYPVTNGD